MKNTFGIPFCEDQWTTVHPSVIASIHRMAAIASTLFHIQQTWKNVRIEAFLVRTDACNLKSLGTRNREYSWVFMGQEAMLDLWRRECNALAVMPPEGTFSGTLRAASGSGENGAARGGKNYSGQFCCTRRVTGLLWYWRALYLWWPWIMTQFCQWAWFSLFVACAVGSQ